MKNFIFKTTHWLMSGFFFVMTFIMLSESFFIAALASLLLFLIFLPLLHTQISKYIPHYRGSVKTILFFVLFSLMTHFSDLESQNSQVNTETPPQKEELVVPQKQIEAELKEKAAQDRLVAQEQERSEKEKKLAELDALQLDLQKISGFHDSILSHTKPADDSFNKALQATGNAFASYDAFKAAYDKSFTTWQYFTDISSPKLSNEKDVKAVKEAIQALDLAYYTRMSGAKAMMKGIDNDQVSKFSEAKSDFEDSRIYILGGIGKILELKTTYEMKIEVLNQEI